MAMASFSAGNRVYASDLEAMARQIDSLTAPGWVDYSGTFTITATVTPPTKGNSTYVARYRQPASSDVLDVEVYISIGSTFVAGSGTYRFLLPTAMPSAELVACHATINESGIAFRSGGSSIVDTTHFEAWADGSNAVIGSSGLFSGGGWTAGDFMRFSMRVSLT